MSRSATRLAWVLAGLLSLRLAVATFVASSVPANGFVTHWTASRLVLGGYDVARFYDDALFVARVGESEPGVSDIFGANPPTVALAALPVAWMPYRTARIIVAMVSVVVWIGSAVWLAALLLPGSLVGPLLVIVAAAFQPAEEGLRHAQLHIAVFGAVLVAWYHWRRQPNPRCAFVGLLLGGTVALKAAGAMFAVMLIAQRRWTAFAWMMGTVVALAIASLPVAGLDAWTAFIARARALGASGTFSVAAYQTVPGLVRRLTVADPQWNPRPWLDLGRLGVAFSWLAVVALVVVTAVVVARRHAEGDSIFAAFAALSVIATPVSLDYHYVITLLPMAILVAREREVANEARLALLGLAVLLIAARLPHLSPRLADGALALLAYPKLYGALLLWWLALTSGRRVSPSESMQTTFVLERAAA